jgi:carbon-monoxide dehydrogenase large subunit
MSIRGTRVPRREDPDLLTGGASYVDDLQPENLAYVTYVTSPTAHARVPMETPTRIHPLGAKGIGESGTIGSAPAVQNAVCDALAHLGVSRLGP